MKSIYVLILVLIISSVNVNKAFPSTQKSLAGHVLKVMTGGGYNYIYIEQADGAKKWVAVADTKNYIIYVGTYLSFKPGTEMGSFKSKALKYTFDSIAFSEGVISNDESFGNNDDSCINLSKYGEHAMAARQEGMPITKMMAIIDESDKPKETKLMHETITNRAYAINIVFGQQTKKMAIESFREDTYSWCVGLSNKKIK